MTGSVDGHEILEEGLRVVFAADQRPFEVPGTGGFVNRFCVLVPLMTEDGRRIVDLEASFPHRGRVWWMLRSDLPAADVRAGSIWVGVIEEAAKKDQDFFQVERQSIRPGLSDWIEIVDIAEPDPDLALLVSGRGLPFTRHPLARVIVRGTRSAVGPLKAVWDGALDTLTMQALNAGDPVTFRFPRELLDGEGRIESFRFVSSKWDPDSNEREIGVTLLHERHLGPLCEAGERLDAASDTQVVKWALGLAQYTKRQRSEFREALESLPDAATVDEAQFPGRLARFRRLCGDGERLWGLGREVAAAIAEAAPELRDFVAAHVEEIAGRRIEERVDAAAARIEAQTDLARRNKEKAEEELRALEERYARRRGELENELEAAHGAWVQSLDERQAALARREADLAAREEEIGSRLGAIIEEYRDGADGIARELLTYLPILRGLGAGGSATDAEPARDAGGAIRAGFDLQLPEALESAVPSSGLDERAFLDQLRGVAARRGFVYEDDDLVNFHVSLKVGAWTVVAGATGLGKSTLPRLYAEALGMRERYLKVPVQPDWLDDRDVLGAYNSLSARFEPATTGLVQHLIHAEEDARRGLGGLYLVCLDEMNLSRVEHYFARFLSILEDPLEQRVLTLIGPGVGDERDPFVRHRRVRIGDNLRFVGTVNVDETTHFFSPKVLDRSTLLTLDPPDLARSRVPATQASELAVQPVPLDEWQAWIRRSDESTEAERRLVLEIDAKLRPIHSGLGFRLRDRILSYLASSRGLFGSAERALDLAVSQTVLPRLRTHHPGFPVAAEELLRVLPPERYAKCGRILEALREAGGEYDFFQLL